MSWITADGGSAMRLEDFLPYRLALLAEAVSQCMAQVYRERFGLARDEWRVLAHLAGSGAAVAATPVKTTEVIRRTALDKMQVSRAVARLERDGLVQRHPDPDDGRGWRLELSAAGRALHAQVVPMVQAREAILLEVLSAAERRVLDAALLKMQQRAEQMLRAG
jgi:DNA-binding MarR family transcriptional regulator